MKDSVKERIALIRDAETPEELRKHLCPFFEKGGNPDCIACRRTEADLDECREYYLERIGTFPMEVWSEEFDKVVVNPRDTIEVKAVIGIGINCDSCYMSDKCPLFKKGFVCAIDWGSDRPKNSLEFMDFLINTQFERVKRTSIFEKIDGGVPDMNLSTEMDRLSDLISRRDDMGREKLSINVEASGPSRDGGGILSKIFGGGGTPKIEAPTAPKELPTSTVEYIDVEEEKPATVKRRRRRNNEDSD